MKVCLAESAGFCFGVERAVRMTEQALEEHGSCWCLGELIHNKDAVRVLAEKGLKTAESVADVPAGVPVIVRSHGVPKWEYDALEQKGCTVINATCPKVARIHKIVERAAGEERTGAPVEAYIRFILFKLILNQVHDMLIICLRDA